MATNFPFRIDLQCPQCGAPAELEEMQQIVDCPYCRVRHVVQNNPQLTVSIPPQTDIPKSELFFIPYWRFKGSAFAFDRTRVRSRVIDASSLAINSMGLPHSLGLRSQTQALRFVTPETPGAFLVPRVPQKEMRTRLSSQFLGQGTWCGPPPVQSHVGEVLSLIFAPCAVTSRGVFDGLTGRLLSGVKAADLLEQESSAPPSTCSFRPCLCPRCGWDLEGQTDSHVLGCPGCKAMWISHKSRFMNVSATMGSGASGDLWLPFWQFQVQASTIHLNTRADLIRLANLPQAVHSNDARSELCFRIPAFQVQPKIFLRLARQITVFDVPTQPLDNQDFRALYPATLPLQEGFQAILPLICDLAWDKQSIEPALSGCRMRPTRSELVYVPFVEQRSEVVQPDLKTGFLKSALDLGRLL